MTITSLAKQSVDLVTDATAQTSTANCHLELLEIDNLHLIRLTNCQGFNTANLLDNQIMLGRLLWVVSGPTRLYHPNGRYRAESGQRFSVSKPNQTGILLRKTRQSVHEGNMLDLDK